MLKGGVSGIELPGAIGVDIEARDLSTDDLVVEIRAIDIGCGEGSC